MQETSCRLTGDPKEGRVLGHGGGGVRGRTQRGETFTCEVDNAESTRLVQSSLSRKDPQTCLEQKVLECKLCPTCSI